MFLSNSTIEEYIQKGKIQIDGDYKIEISGVSLHLGNELLLPSPYQTVDSSNPKEIEYVNYDLTKNPYVLKPNDFILGSSKEIIKTDRDILTFLDGRSTYARCGMSIHISAMMLDGLPFNKESSVLEIKNMGFFNIVLHAGDRVGTYIFSLLSSPINGEKNSAYKNQSAVTPPSFF